MVAVADAAPCETNVALGGGVEFHVVVGGGNIHAKEIVFGKEDIA